MSGRITLLLAAVLLIGCGTSGDLELRRGYSPLCDTGDIGLSINSTGRVPDGCVKIEGSQIGQAPQTLQLKGMTVTLTGWVNKVGQPGEKVGFSFTATGPVAYAVKASTRTFVGTATSWVHPDGTSGSGANGISNVTFCPGEGGGEPDGGSGGGEPGGGSGGGEPDGGSGGGEPGGECPPEAGSDGGTVVTEPAPGCTLDSDCASGQKCYGGSCHAQIG